MARAAGRALGNQGPARAGLDPDLSGQRRSPCAGHERGVSGGGPSLWCGGPGISAPRLVPPPSSRIPSGGEATRVARSVGSRL